MNVDFTIDELKSIQECLNAAILDGFTTDNDDDPIITAFNKVVEAQELLNNE